MTPTIIHGLFCDVNQTPLGLKNSDRLPSPSWTLGPPPAPLRGPTRVAGGTLIPPLRKGCWCRPTAQRTRPSKARVPGRR